MKLPPRAFKVQQKIYETIKREALFRRGEKVLLALSGGPDSTALLLVLSQLVKEYRLRLRAAHVNYRCRGRESGGDQRQVRALCRRLGIELDVHCLRAGELSKVDGKGFQDKARELRFNFFSSLCRTHGLKKVLLGHNADDQVEGLFLRLLRGAGPGGLAGIPYRRDYQGMVLIRPLLDCRREELLEFLAGKGVAYRTDSSNRGLDYRRNRVRNKLLPLLRREFNPRLDEAVWRVNLLLRDEDEYLTKLTGGLLAEVKKRGVMLKADLVDLHPALARRLLREYIWLCRPGSQLRWDQVEMALLLIRRGPKNDRWRLALAGGIELACDGKELVVSEGQARVDQLSPKIFYLTSAGEYRPAAYGLRLVLREEKLNRRKLQRQAADTQREFLDADKINWPLLLRVRQPGDRFQPLGMVGKKKLKDFYTDLKLSPSARKDQPLLLCGGEIAWVIGKRIDARFAVGPETRRVLYIEVDFL